MPGWQHTFEVRLVAEPDGSITYVNDELHAERFARATDGTFVTPAGYHETLAVLTDGFKLMFKDGARVSVPADGQLTAIQDPNDHLVLLRYDAGQALERHRRDGASRAHPSSTTRRGSSRSSAISRTGRSSSVTRTATWSRSRTC